MSAPPVVAISGASGAGKTTLMEELLPRLIGRGLRVTTLKHAHCLAEVDVPGKDTWRHRQAGAVRAVLEARGARATFERVPGRRATARELAARFGGDADLVLAEGFRGEPLPRIEVLAADAPAPVEHAGAEWRRAVRARDGPHEELFDRQDLERIADELVALARGRDASAERPDWRADRAPRRARR